MVYGYAASHLVRLPPSPSLRPALKPPLLDAHEILPIMSSANSTDPTAAPSAAADDAPNCASGGGANTFFGLRVAAIFIVMTGSMFGAMFPIIARRTRIRAVVPKAVFE